MNKPGAAAAAAAAATAAANSHGERHQLVHEALVADAHRLDVPELGQRHAVGRAARAEDLAAVAAVVAPLDHGEGGAAAHALRRLHVRYPDRGTFVLRTILQTKKWKMLKKNF